MNDRVSEAERCLGCKNARCSMGCPVATAIPRIIELYKEGDLREAGRILFENNPMSSICSVVCPHEDNCIGNCVLGIKGRGIDFPEIEREISYRYLAEEAISKESENGRNIAIIGSGPAGLTLAFMMLQKGYGVTIFEKYSKLGGVLRYGIPEFRLPKDILDLMEKRLVELGAQIRYNDLIGPVNNVEDLLADGYDAVFIGTGVWNPRPLRINGETMGHVHYAVNYLKSPESFNLKDRVVVIGAGNVAMDAARTAKRMGAGEVIIAYRRGEEDMKATRKEIEEARDEGVKFSLNSSPYEIVKEGIILKETKNIIGKDGVERLTEIDGSQHLMRADSVIIAVSQDPSDNIARRTRGELRRREGLISLEDGGMTSIPGVFSGGDVVTGAATVAEAVAGAKRSAQAIEEYISKKKDRRK